MSKDPSSTVKSSKTPLKEMGGSGSKRDGGRKAAATGNEKQKPRDRILANRANIGKVMKRTGSGLNARNFYQKERRFPRSTRLTPNYGKLSPGSAYLSCKSLCRRPGYSYGLF